GDAANGQTTGIRHIEIPHPIHRDARSACKASGAIGAVRTASKSVSAGNGAHHPVGAEGSDAANGQATGTGKVETPHSVHGDSGEPRKARGAIRAVGGARAPG